MTATFSNTRLNSFPAESMNARLLFAENYVSEPIINDNDGAVTGTPTINRGAVMANADVIQHDVIETDDDFSAMVRFRASALQTAAYPLATGISADGFYIELNASGVKANHISGATVPTACEVAIDYSDNEWHSVFYVVDLTNGKHTLYVDDLDAVEESTTITGTITPLTGISSGQFDGELYMSRVFDSAISAATIAAYKDFDPTTFLEFMKTTGAVYRCDSVGDDTVGHKIWDKQPTVNDLYKGDRSDASAFPTFDTDKYLFDYSDDYVSNLMTLPAEYTTSAVISTPQSPRPYVRQDNDKTFLDMLTTPGGFWGYLHNLIIHDSTLDALQAYHSEYMQMYYLKRGNADGLYNRLSTEGTGKIELFLRQGYTNDAKPGGAFIGTGTVQDSDGVTFPNSDSNLMIADRADFRVKNGSAVFYGDFDTIPTGIAYFGQKGGNYFLAATSHTLMFNGVSISYTISNNQQIAVTWKDGEKARFYVDGEFVGEGGTAITSDDTDTSPLYIGNSNSLNTRLPYNLKQVYIGDQPLTDVEIYALFLQARTIGATSMEVGNRNEKVFASVATAFSDTFDPGQAFQLIEARIDFDVLPTTSEEFKIYTVRTSDGKEKFEGSIDPSLQSELSVPVRFDKRIPTGHTVKLTYSNTDANNIVVSAVYQTDDSVN